MSGSVAQDVPLPSVPVQDSGGNIDTTWYRFFISLWNRTGGPSPAGDAVPGGSNGNVQYNNAGAFGGLTNSQVAAIVLTNTGVAAGPYGGAASVPTFTVGLDGRLTAAADVASSPDGGISLTPFIVTTTNATPTVIATISMPLNTTVLLKSTVMARRTAGSAGTTGDSAGFDIVAVVKNIAGTATVMGQTTVAFARDQVWTAVYSASTSNLVLTVTGAVNNTIDWKMFGTLYEVA